MKIVVKVMVLTLFTFLASVAIDRGLGFIRPGNEDRRGLLFPPHSGALYKTSEFEFSASINSLGFRDREFDVAKGDRYRIIAIGNSFTYGWGVNVEESWPKVLERNLNSEGIPVEVANLGCQGIGPKEYADLAEKAIPLLRPDLVLIATTQGSDLEASRPRKPEVNDNSKGGRTNLISEVLRRIYPNTTRITRAVSAEATKEHPRLDAFVNEHPRLGRLISLVVHKPSADSEWRTQQERLLAHLNAEERKRYAQLDQAAKDAFISGGLNPALIDAAIRQPEFFMRTFDIHKNDVQFLIDELANHDRRIARIAGAHKTRVMVVSLPFGIYVNDRIFERWKRYGFVVDPSMRISSWPDDAIRVASERAGLPFLTVTAQFREHRNSELYYTLDGHLNVAGQRFYADQLTEEIARLIRNGRG